MRDKATIVLVLITLLLCIVLVVLARQNFNDEYNTKHREIEETHTQLTIDAIRDNP